MKMYFKKIFMDENGAMTYLVGCPAEKVACVVDPKKGNVQEYIETAIKYGMKITHIFDTHALEDPLDGNMELKSRTGADLYYLRLPDDGAHHLVAEEGMMFNFGQARISVVSSPCHDPFVNCIKLTDVSDKNEPWLVLRPESLFIGDIDESDTGGKALSDSVTQYLDFEGKNYNQVSDLSGSDIEQYQKQQRNSGYTTPHLA